MAGRGRPKKKVEVPETVQELINRVEPELVEAIPYVEPINKESTVKTKFEWDVTANEEITYFDPTLSYELTGYRPIDETHGLDFDPSWFTEVRETFLRTGRYCSYLPRSKRWDAFWKEQYTRCKYGMTSHGYTITGDNYFFLNFY